VQLVCSLWHYAQLARRAIDFGSHFDIIITIQNDWRLINMYGAFWSIYWQYWADRREEEKKKK
jgi:hypothetical protein